MRLASPLVTIRNASSNPDSLEHGQVATCEFVSWAKHCKRKQGTLCLADEADTTPQKLVHSFGLYQAANNHWSCHTSQGNHLDNILWSLRQPSERAEGCRLI
jgi:hypothetical protein